LATETVPIDDKGMLADIMADEPAQEPAKEQPEQQAAEPERVEQPRYMDELGRFVAKTEDAKPEAVEQPTVEEKPEPTEQPKEDGGQVPSWRLRELREAREAAERRAEEVSRQAYAQQQQLAALQRQLADLQRPKQEPVDFFQNPDGAIDQRLSPIEERYARLESQMRLNTSRAIAIAMHGPKAVSEMEEAVEKASRENHPDIGLLAAQMRASEDPVNVAMQWHKRNRLMDVTGGDPEAYRQRVLDEAMKDPTFQAKVLEAARGQVQPNSRPNIQLPPSLSKVPGSAPDHNDVDMSDAGIFRDAMNNR
jgi:hypothetical protein